ncbi:MAG: hypothetical protein IJ629_01130 [Clostridia bacterium]|nr:hypothetical protein [Clostridia bacterium]
MEKNEVKMGEKFISGKMISLDDDDIEELDQASKSLKQVERNIKENIASKMK